MSVTIYRPSSSSLHPNPQFDSSIKPPYPTHSSLKLSRTQLVPKSINGGTVRRASTEDDKPYRLLPGGKISYYDERDVVSFLDPTKQFIPLDPSSYNPAAYLWKKIDDIPEERRLHLLELLNPRLISRAWEVAGTRYDDAKLAKQSSSSVFAGAKLHELWHCRTDGGPLAVSWANYFKKALFCCEDGQTFGRVVDASIVGRLWHRFAPLYFRVREVKEVMATEQPCDVAYEFGSGLLEELQHHPQGFPKPGKHPWPLNDDVVIYVRHVGPGVVVGQAWQQGEDMNQLPKKLCGEILMVKDYAH